MRLTLSNEEIEYIKKEYDNKRIIEIVARLKTMINKRTQKKYSEKYIQKVIGEIGLPRKHKVEKPRNKYAGREIIPVNMDLDIKKVMTTSINGYKPIQKCKNFVLYEKEVRGVKLRTSYTFSDLYHLFKEVENGQKETRKLPLD